MLAQILNPNLFANPVWHYLQNISIDLGSHNCNPRIQEERPNCRSPGQSALYSKFCLCDTLSQNQHRKLCSECHHLIISLLSDRIIHQLHN